jgi:hypothetical protein
LKPYIVLSVVIALSGCVSIGNPFVHMKPNYATLPVDAMREVAKDIEKAVHAGEREPRIADRGGIVVNHQTVTQAVRTRAVRAGLVKELLDSGFAREDRDGLISILRSSEYKKKTAAKDRDRNALVVMNENSDRWALYEGLVEAGKLAPRSRSAIQEIFYQARLEFLAPGQKYEDASGNTATK